MNRLTRQQIEALKALYPAGTRIELVSMEDPYRSFPAGTKGTVALVDDMGTIHMKWENGSTLGIIPGVDVFRKISN